MALSLRPLASPGKEGNPIQTSGTFRGLMRITCELKPVEVLDDNDDIYELVFNCTFEEFMYGQDADNNRGEWRKEIVHYELAYCYLNSHEIDPYKVPKEILNKAEKEL